MTWSPWVMGITNEASRSLVVFLQISEGCAHLPARKWSARLSDVQSFKYFSQSLLAVFMACLSNVALCCLVGVGWYCWAELFMLRPHIQLCDHSLQIHLHTTLVFLSFVANHNGFDWFLYQLDTSDFKACVVCHNCHGIAIATWEVGSLFFFLFQRNPLLSALGPNSNPSACTRTDALTHTKILMTLCAECPQVGLAEWAQERGPDLRDKGILLP